MSAFGKYLVIDVMVYYLPTLISFFTLFLCLPQHVTTLPGKSPISETTISNRTRSPHGPASGITSMENQHFLTPTSPGQPSTPNQLALRQHFKPQYNLLLYQENRSPEIFSQITQLRICQLRQTLSYATTTPN